MQFIVMAYDYKDKNALTRRLAARDQHLKFAKEMFDKKRWLFASALLDDNGNMNGSVIACEFETEDELHKLWLDNEAYISGKVWEKIIIRKAKIAELK
jgi:uncharacterized protein YciI